MTVPNPTYIRLWSDADTFTVQHNPDDICMSSTDSMKPIIIKQPVHLLNSSITDLGTKINDLEMQITILMDQISQLTNAISNCTMNDVTHPTTGLPVNASGSCVNNFIEVTSNLS